MRDFARSAGLLGLELLRTVSIVASGLVMLLLIVGIRTVTAGMKLVTHIVNRLDAWLVRFIKHMDAWEAKRKAARQTIDKPRQVAPTPACHAPRPRRPISIERLKRIPR